MMGHIAGLCTCAAALLTIAPHMLIAQAEQNVRITWAPERPVQGTLFRVHVTPLVSGARIAGKIAGEPLHFSESAAGWEALAAAPLDQGSELEVMVQIERNDRVDSVHAR